MICAGSWSCSRLAGGIIGCDDDSPVPPVSDEYTIYDQLLTQLPLGGNRPENAYVIRAETSFPDHLHHPSNVTYLKGHFPDDPALVDHLVTSNIKPVRLNMRRFSLRVIPVENEEIVRIVGASPTWEEFEKLYPGSRVAFGVSQVAFNADGTAALVYWDYICGGLCGAGLLTQMKLIDDEWVIVKTLGLWIS